MGQNTEGALAAEEAPLRRAEKRKDMNDHILYNPLAGGGMIPTPQQDRLAQPKQLSVMVYHSQPAEASGAHGVPVHLQG